MLADWERRVQQQTALTTELSQRIEQTTVTVESRGGEVSVTVDSSGGLANLRLDPKATRLPAADLAALILDTSRRAQATLADRVAEVASRVYGAGSETAAFIGGVYTRQFPAQAEQDEERRR